MFHSLESNDLLKKVLESRTDRQSSTDIALTSILGNYEFGRALFGRILNKGVLKPGSIKLES